MDLMVKGAVKPIPYILRFYIPIDFTFNKIGFATKRIINQNNFWQRKGRPFFVYVYVYTVRRWWGGVFSTYK